MRTALIALVAIALWFGWDDWYQRAILHPPGQRASAEPVQRDIASAPTIRHGKYALTPRAEFTATARVLSTERYRFDPLADLVPRDVALGWGPMSDSAVLAQIDVSQSGRFYFWRAPRALAEVSLTEIATNSANMHLIPANASVARVIERARVGHIIELAGQLVDVRGDDGRQMRTSLTRSDTGAGACEIIYVERASTR